jgi:type IV pilus assembly protein PilF
MTARLLHSMPAIAMAALVLAACASKERTATTPPPDPLPPVKLTEATPQKRAQLHTDLGAGYYERGQMDVALEELNEAIKLDPNIAKTYNILGLVYTMLREDAKAEENFRRALALAPSDPEGRANWGWYLCTHDRMRESLPEFDLAIRDPLYKTPDVALVNAGRCAATIGENGRAEAYYRRALQIQPSNGNAAFGLATLKYQAQRYDEARTYMKIVMAQNTPTSEMLYLGMCVEKALGDGAAEASYISQLRNRFPDSPEAAAIGKKLCG